MIAGVASGSSIGRISVEVLVVRVSVFGSLASGATLVERESHLRTSELFLAAAAILASFALLPPQMLALPVMWLLFFLTSSFSSKPAIALLILVTSFLAFGPLSVKVNFSARA